VGGRGLTEERWTKNREKGRKKTEISEKKRKESASLRGRRGIAGEKKRKKPLDGNVLFYP